MQEKRGEVHISNLPQAMLAGRENQVQGAGEPMRMGVLSGHKSGLSWSASPHGGTFWPARGKNRSQEKEGSNLGKGWGKILGAA